VKKRKSGIAGMRYPGRRSVWKGEGGTGGGGNERCGVSGGRLGEERLERGKEEGRRSRW